MKSPDPESIPEPAVRRLSLYLRQLETVRMQGVRTVSSRELGDSLNLTDAQVRKDLAYFGQFGQPGIGYQVDDLVSQLRRILGTDRVWNVAIVGLGNLGRALAAYRGFLSKGFQIAAVFDTDPAKVGAPVPGLETLTVQHLDELAETVAQRRIRLAILTVPASAAQAVADKLVAAGVRGILNFAPITLNVPPDVRVGSTDLAVQLEQIAFHLLAGSPKF